MSLASESVISPLETDSSRISDSALKEFDVLQSTPLEPEQLLDSTSLDTSAVCQFTIHKSKFTPSVDYPSVSLKMFFTNRILFVGVSSITCFNTDFCPATPSDRIQSSTHLVITLEILLQLIVSHILGIHYNPSRHCHTRSSDTPLPSCTDSSNAAAQISC